MSFKTTVSDRMQKKKRVRLDGWQCRQDAPVVMVTIYYKMILSVSSCVSITSSP